MLKYSRAQAKLIENEEDCYRMTLRMKLPRPQKAHEVVIEIGGIPIALETSDSDFINILQGRYGDYMK